MPPSMFRTWTDLFRLVLLCLTLVTALTLCGLLALLVVMWSTEFAAGGVLVAYVLVASCGSCEPKRKFSRLINLSCLLVLIGLSTWTWNLFL